MNEFYYYKDGDKLFRFQIHQYYSDDAINPRKDWDGNIGTLNLWVRNASFGDNEGKGDPHEVLNDLIHANVPEDKYTEEDLIYNWTVNKKRMLLQYYIVLLPCYMLSHSGYSISCSSFNDRWDSGIAGFIYATKESCKKQWGEIDDNWRKRAYNELVDEVRYYDMYLKDECYYYDQDRYNVETDSWDEDDSVGGFLTDKYGSELVEYIKQDITSQPLISEDEALDLASEMHKEFKIMDQANYIIAI